MRRLEFLQEHHQAIVLLFTDVQMRAARTALRLPAKLPGTGHTSRSWWLRAGPAGPNDLPDGAHSLASRSAPTSCINICGTEYPSKTSPLP